jgi:hypothetical protein
MVALFAVLVIGQATAQDQLDLDRMDDKFTRHLEKKMPGWKHERVEPIQGSRGVLIQTWSSPNRKIKIAVSSAKSAEEAREEMQRFMIEVKGQPLPGLGDNAFVWGFEGSDLEVRRGRFIIDLNAGADVARDPDARMLTPAQQHARQQAEVKRIIREFAKHAVDATDLP